MDDAAEGVKRHRLPVTNQDTGAAPSTQLQAAMRPRGQRPARGSRQRCCAVYDGGEPSSEFSSQEKKNPESVR